MPPKQVPVSVRSASASIVKQATSVKLDKLKQILGLLSTAAKRLHETLHSALCLWLQMHEVFQQHKQNTYAGAAVQAVQAALHAASMCATDDLKLAWMKLHVPCVSKAVTAYVIAQSEISLRRAGILQRLMTAEGQQPSEQLPARWKAEADLYWQLFAEGRVAVFLETLSTVIKALSGVLDVSSSDASSRWQRKGLMHSSQQADELLMCMASDLDVWHPHVPGHVAVVSHSLQDVTDSLGVQWEVPGNVVGDFVLRALDLLSPVSEVWLDIALSLPPTDRHDGAQAWVEVVDWQALMWSAIACRDLPFAQPQFGFMLCCVLARPSYRKVLMQDHVLPVVSLLLVTYSVQIQHLAAVGVPEEVVQQLLQKEEQNPSLTEIRGALAEMHSRAVEHCSRSRLEVNMAGAPGQDDKLNDMQALVELMYGPLNMKE